MAEKTKNPTVQVAKARQNGDENHIVMLADGRKAKVVPVSVGLIEEVTSKIQDPPIPTYHDEERNRDIENPVDPDYLRGLADATRKRGIAAIDAMVMMGVELLDGLPEDNLWEKRLKTLQKRGLLDLSTYDMSDPIEREFLYKRFVAVDSSVLEVVSRVSGVTGEAIAEAEKSFPSNA